MANEKFEDFGFGEKWTNRVGRFIRPDGTFNIERTGSRWSNLHLYQWLVTMSWSHFFLLVIGFYIFVNATFGILHLLIGIETLSIPKNETLLLDFADAFFFSVQTFTTVGYGTISPTGIWANIIAAICALVGLMSFALATGLFFARFARPTAKVHFSKNALITSHNDGQAFMFRMVNARRSQLMNLFIQVTFTYIETDENDISKRRFERLKLERDSVYLFPLNWTIVHPIDKNSPLFNCTLKHMQKIDAEVLIVLSAFDVTFAQQVHTKYSYTYEEFMENTHFASMYYTNEFGTTILEMDKLNEMK
jgi:inward rectifier potassium channel